MKFREFLNLCEAGKNPIKIHWNKQKFKWTSRFEINNIEYNIEAYTNDDLDLDFKVWEFKFFKDLATTQITGDFKTHFILVPTIIDAFDEFVKEAKPDSVLFIAADDSKSRKSLYKINSDNIAHKYNYISVNPHLPDNDILFGICKDKGMVQDIKKLIGIY